MGCSSLPMTLKVRYSFLSMDTQSLHVRHERTLTGGIGGKDLLCWTDGRLCPQNEWTLCLTPICYPCCFLLDWGLWHVCCSWLCLIMLDSTAGSCALQEYCGCVGWDGLSGEESRRLIMEAWKCLSSILRWVCLGH